MALGSIYDDNCTLLQGASSLRASKAKNYQKCETVVVSELQEAAMCDGFVFVHALSTIGMAQTQPATDDP